MKEITRVHIAKVAYDIEVLAKKAIEKYIGSLERYADDPELLTDIEIRITELLADRGVLPGGVISSDDIAAVKILSDVAKKNEALELKAGIIEGNVQDKAKLEEFARIPSREGLYTMLAGGMIGIVKDLSIALNLLAEQKEN